MNASKLFRVAVAVASVGTITALGAALQPDSAPASTPQPAGQPGQPAQPAQPAQPGGGQPGGGPRGPRQPGQAESVEAAMKGMNRSLRRLREQVNDATKKDDNLKLVNDMQRACVVAKGQPLPASVLARAKDDAEKAAWSTTYRADLMKSLRLMLDLEQAIIDGKSDAASAALDSLVEIKIDSHKVMGVDED